MVATPSLTLTVTPPGGSPTTYTTKMAWANANQQMSITQNFGRQGDTAVIPLIDDYQGLSGPTFHIPVLSQVTLYDNIAAQNLFAGVVNDPVFTMVGPTQNEWDLNCTDYTFYADNAIVQGTFNGYTVDQIVVALTEQASCGISAATVQDGGFVAPGPTLASFVQNYDSLSNAWKNLAQLAGQITPYGWYVDQNRALHFYDATTAISSGVTHHLRRGFDHGRPLLPGHTVRVRVGRNHNPQQGPGPGGQPDDPRRPYLGHTHRHLEG